MGCSFERLVQHNKKIVTRKNRMIPIMNIIVEEFNIESDLGVKKRKRKGISLFTAAIAA